MEKLIAYFKANPEFFEKQIELFEKLSTAKEGDTILFVSDSRIDASERFQRCISFLKEYNISFEANITLKKIIVSGKIILFRRADIDAIRGLEFYDAVVDYGVGRSIYYDIQSRCLKNRQ